MTNSNEARITQARERGFTLLELMIAMAVTLVITGAMFTMVTNAQTSFRREPALADRQMEIRIAMDRIQEDILNAGSNQGPFSQAFLTGRNGVGPLGLYPLGRPIYGGGNSDVLELRMLAADCPSLRTQPGFGPGAAPGNDVGPNYALGKDESDAALNPAWTCYNQPGFVLATFFDGRTKVGWRDQATAPGAVNLDTPADAQSELASLGDRTCSIFPTPGSCPLPAAPIDPVEQFWRPATFTALDQVRYEIGPDTDPLIPALYRSTRGGLNNAGVREPAGPGRAQWQQIARGIEDLQIRYKTGPPDNQGLLPDANWADNAPVIASANFNTIVRQVEVTLWARALGQVNLQGQNNYANLGLRANIPLAVRGSLITIVTPRAVEAVLSTAPAGNTNRWQ